jgi:hypothetical protein
MNRITLPMLTLGFSLAFTFWGCSAKPSSEHSKTTAEAEQAKAIAEVEKLGGEVAFDEKSPGKPVIEVTLANPKVTDTELANLRAFTKLERLDLTDAREVTDAGLE